jgi:hypothetical protein
MALSVVVPKTWQNHKLKIEMRIMMEVNVIEM